MEQASKDSSDNIRMYNFRIEKQLLLKKLKNIKVKYWKIQRELFTPKYNENPLGEINIVYFMVITENIGKAVQCTA